MPVFLIVILNNPFECLINVINNILAFLVCCMEYKFATKRNKRLVNGAVPLKGQVCHQKEQKACQWGSTLKRTSLPPKGTKGLSLGQYP